MKSKVTLEAFSDEAIQKLFGSEAAEDEDPDRLRDYFFRSQVYESLRADLPLKIIVGHKGIGKSALIRVALREDEQQGTISVLIRPDDIADLSLAQENFLQLINSWKKGLTEIIARKVLATIGDVNGELVEKFKAYSASAFSLLLDSASSLKSKPELLPTQRKAIDNLLKNRRVSVYLDDLDRGWEGKSSDIKRVSALLNAIRDIGNENRSIKFKVALRSDVYFLVRTSDESTDKIESAVTWHSWSNHEILALLVKRVELFFGEIISEENLIKEQQPDLGYRLRRVIAPRFLGRGKWSDIPTYQMMMSLIRKRPRDLVKLCTLAAKNAQKNRRNIIHSEDFQAIFEEYSQGRIQDTINEYRSEMPEIERLVMSMKPSKKDVSAAALYTFSTDALIKKIKKIEEQGKFKFRSGHEASEVQLIQFLYKINFITAKKVVDTEFIQRRYFEESRYLASEFADFGFQWEIHPAYRWALQPSDLNSIFEELEQEKI